MNSSTHNTSTSTTQFKEHTGVVERQEEGTMAPNSLPSTRPLPEPPLHESRPKQPTQAPQPVIKKPQGPFRRRQFTDFKAVLSKRKQALELENRLESNLAVAAGRITSLTKNILAKQTNPELMKDSQLMFYITRLRVVSEELKLQFMTMGKCSKMSNQQDHVSFDSSYQRTLALWREYQRISGCIAQRARLGGQTRKESDPATNDSSGSSVLPNSSTNSASANSAQQRADDTPTK